MPPLELMMPASYSHPTIKEQRFVVKLKLRPSTLKPDIPEDLPYTEHSFIHSDDALDFFIEETNKGMTGYIVRCITTEEPIYPVRIKFF